MSGQMPSSDVSPETLASLPEFYHPAVSPDGDEIACYHDASGRNELCIADRETGAVEQVSDGEVPKDATWWLQWDDSGERVFFHRDDAGDEQNDVLAMDREGTVETLVDVDGQAMLADVGDDALLYASDAGEQLNLYRHDLSTGESVQLTEYAQPVMGGRFSPDGDRVAYVTNESRNLDNRDVYLMAADGSDKRRLEVGEAGSETLVHDWFPDGERLLVSDDATGRRRTGVHHVGSAETEWFGPDETPETPHALSPDGRLVVATRDRDAAEMPVVYDVETGEGSELDVPVGVASFPRSPSVRVFADERTIVFGHSTPSERSRLLEYDLATDESRVVLDADYGDVDPDTFVDAEYVTYEGADGWDIGGLLYDPRDGPSRPDDATNVPGVVMVHGGPAAQAQQSFSLFAQFLVSQGYAVFQPNYRGSTGRGREFEHAIHDDWGGKEQDDVAAGGRWLMDRDWVDADRVSVFGGSYGGYSVYTQLTKYPDLWTTGVAWIGITDLHRLYEEDMAHFQHVLRQHMGDPEENHDLWRDRSPIEHVDAMERPIFVIHGVNDPRCPIEQARIFRDALVERGWEQGSDFEYEELGDEGHGSTDVDHRIRAFELLADYLDRRL